MQKGVCNALKQKRMLIICFTTLILGILLLTVSLFIPRKNPTNTFDFRGELTISSISVSLSNCDVIIKESDDGKIHTRITSDGEIVVCKLKGTKIIIKDSPSLSEIFSKNILRYGFSGIGGMIRSAADNERPTVEIYLPSDYLLSSVSITLEDSVLNADLLSSALLVARLKDSDLKADCVSLARADIISYDSTARLNYTGSSDTFFMSSDSNVRGIFISGVEITSGSYGDKEAPCSAVISANDSEIYFNFSK